MNTARYRSLPTVGAADPRVASRASGHDHLIARTCDPGGPASTGRAARVSGGGRSRCADMPWSRYAVHMPVAARPGSDGWSATRSAVESPADNLRSFVTFVRDDPSDCGDRQVFVRIDGDRRLVLAFGDAIEIEVQPGLHHFRIHNTLFWRHVRIGIEPGERLQCRIVNSARWWTAGVVGILGAAPLFLSVHMTALEA